MKVLSLGGSLIVPESIDTEYLIQFKEFVLRHVDQGEKFVIICGGGKVCRNYYAALNIITKAPSVEYDRLGVKSTELNAELVRILFGDAAHPVVQPDYTKKTPFESILIGCGLKPGTSTDYDAIQYAITCGADAVLNLSNISFVYDKDPTHHKDAKPYERLTWSEFRSMFSAEWKAGTNVPFDPIASELAHRHGIKVMILHGRDLENVEKALQGLPFKGTLIS